MLTKEELTEAYKNFKDQKILHLAKNDSKSLREEAVAILENEIIKRKLIWKVRHSVFYLYMGFLEFLFTSSPN